MRIWLQSATSLGYDPKFDLYRESVKRSAQKVIRADTVVDVKGVKVYPIDASVSDYFDHLHIFFLLSFSDSVFICDGLILSYGNAFRSFLACGYTFASNKPLLCNSDYAFNRKILLSQRRKTPLGCVIRT